MNIADIKIGERRRKNLGDINGLAESIAARGLLHPIVIRTDGTLVAGERRLAAARSLGWGDIQVTVASHIDDVTTALLAERDENTCRLDFSPSEAVAIAAEIEPLEQQAARDRLRESGKVGGEKKGSVTFTDPSKGDSGDKIAAAVGMSRPTLAKAKAVVEAAREHPADYGDIAEEMDRTGEIKPAYNKLAERSARSGNPKVRLPHATEPKRPTLKPSQVTQVRGTSVPVKAAAIIAMGTQLRAIQKHVDRPSLQISPIELRRLVSEFTKSFASLEKLLNGDLA